MAGVSEGGEGIGGPERLAAAGLGAGRIALGAALWLAPERSAGMLGFPRLDAAGIALSRLAATRDLVFGAAQLAALGDRDNLRRATLGAAIVDAGDMFTFALALGDRRTRAAGVRGLPFAGLAMLAGASLASRLHGS